jgi:hypothetical protein
LDRGIKEGADEVAIAEDLLHGVLKRVLQSGFRILTIPRPKDMPSVNVFAFEIPIEELLTDGRSTGPVHEKIDPHRCVDGRAPPAVAREHHDIGHNRDASSVDIEASMG